MRILGSVIILLSVILASSCRNDFESEPSTGNLEFSRDTVFLDTVFSNIGSSTYNLKVYNRSDKDINIPSIKLANGETSNYRLNVDGLPGKSFENIQIFAKDSIFIFIETTVEITNNLNQLLYTDQILFDVGPNEQKVELVTLVQDAVFLFPEDLGNGVFETLNLGMDDDGNDILIEGFFLDDNELTFTNEKPYVIYGYAAVPPQKTLIIQPGARVHFHESSGILVANTASLKANGAPSSDLELLENQIIFEGDRLEPSFANTPGQWGTIWLTSGSTNNELSYVTIKNGIVGVLMDDNDGDETLTLRNVEIYNSGNVGLLTRNANIYGENIAITNSGQSSLAIQLGGTYTFNHCTFANYWNNSFRNLPAVSVTNSFPIGNNEVIVADLVAANFNNCIIYGSEQREIGLLNQEGAAYNFNFSNCLIRFEDPQGDFEDIAEYNFLNPTLYTNCTVNVDPFFQDFRNNNLNIESINSGADGIGNIPTASQVPTDLNNTPRSQNAPDAGAYESIIFPKG